MELELLRLLWKSWLERDLNTVETEPRQKATRSKEYAWKLFTASWRMELQGRKTFLKVPGTAELGAKSDGFRVVERRVKRRKVLGWCGSRARHDDR